MKLSAISLTFLGIATSVLSGSPPNRHTVCISNGCIQGKSEKGNVKGYDAYYGIPFATPPTGFLRFKVMSTISKCSIDFSTGNSHFRTRDLLPIGISYGMPRSQEVPVFNQVT